MEKLKALSEALNRDPRNAAFVLLETLQPPTIEDHYAELSSVSLNAQVPAEVQSYFATIQNVCLYAWFSYDLYTVVDLLCFTAVEMALRKRIPHTGAGKDRRTLQKLMDQAVSQ